MSSTTDHGIEVREEPAPPEPGESRTEQQTRDIPSLLTLLFEGHLPEELVFPFPEIPKQERETLDVLASSVDRFLKGRVDPAQIDRHAEIPEEVLSEFQELGLFGLLVPEEYGGLDLSQAAYTQVLARIAGHCASTAATVGAHSSIGIKSILLFGSEEQKTKWLPELASGEKIGAFCLAEPGSGSDAGSIQTRAEPQSDGSWILNGSKIWVTNRGIGGLYTVFAVTPAPGRWRRGKPHHACFIVDRSDAGLTVGPEEEKLGLRGSSTTTLTFEDVHLPADRLVGEDGKGFKIALEILASGRLGLAGGCCGSARKLLADALEQAKTRQQFGQSIASFELIQQKLSKMATELYGMESLVYLVSGIADQRRCGAKSSRTALEAAAAKVYCTERLWETAHEALQIAGGNGFMREFPYERALRDARVNMILEGTNEILRIMMALGALKSPGKTLSWALKGMKKVAGFLPSIGKLIRMHFGPLPRFTCPIKDNEEAKDLWDQVETCLRALPLAARQVLFRHGKRILDAQEVLGILADLSMEALVALATFSRTFRLPEPLESELLLCKAAIEDRTASVQSLLRKLRRIRGRRNKALVNWLLLHEGDQP
ncbi:MAG: acyl-CoA dehydrogenase family protein, partial [Planctomycetota bacterium]